MQNDRDNVMDSFFEYCSNYTSLAIYGAGAVGRMTADFLQEKEILFDCFCVTRKPENTVLQNHEIKEIDEVIRCPEKMGIIVAVSRKNADEILEILDKRGCRYYYSAEFLFRLFKRKCQLSVARVQIEDGFLVRVREVVLRQDTCYVCCPASIGDTLYVAAFMQAYKTEGNTPRRVCLILKKSHRELGNMFSGADEIIVSDEMVETLDWYSMYTQTWRLKNYIYGHFKKSLRFEYDSEYFREGCGGILARYRKLVLNLGEDARLENMVRNLNKEHAVKRNMDIVIMPYAQTAGMLRDSFWEELVRRLREKGYSVYTNVGSEKEKAIPGTAAVTESLRNTALFCEKCGAVISLRSGMCDLLGFMEVKLIVVNTSKELSDEWNLNEVFERKDIHNIDCFGEEEYKEKLDEIMKVVG